MTKLASQTLETVIRDDSFPEADLALRRGRHIGRDDGAVYDFLVDALDYLEPFYRRFGCELIQRSDGYFYLLPSGEKLGRRQLSPGEMLVGQTLALLYLDPSTLQHGGLVKRELLLHRLSGLVRPDALLQTLNRRRKTKTADERVSGEQIRTHVAEALRKLSDLGFVDLVDDGHLRLRSALLRFTDPVRSASDSVSALEQLVAHGEVFLGDTPDVEMAATEEDEVTS